MKLSEFTRLLQRVIGEEDYEITRDSLDRFRFYMYDEQVGKKKELCSLIASNDSLLVITKETTKEYK